MLNASFSSVNPSSHELPKSSFHESVAAGSAAETAVVGLNMLTPPKLSTGRVGGEFGRKAGETDGDGRVKEGGGPAERAGGWPPSIGGGPPRVGGGPLNIWDGPPSIGGGPPIVGGGPLNIGGGPPSVGGGPLIVRGGAVNKGGLEKDGAAARGGPDPFRWGRPPLTGAAMGREWLMLGSAAC